ncbi:aromatase/cyclase [Streptomyces sp. ISL-44]|uniref:aromatase/cyclase n=1 Tax=Streptomyces sp. ISL-44 TaxID=2819184 RepID=UPI001BEB6101|nr:aromatase/cyclase [Streptomyces sp. ISL-44]MBT2544777.1 aromatase/cyclase [Streptomyces sp. ISL-44]
MTGDRVHRRTYAVDVAAPAGVVYGLIADTTQWPLFVPPSIHVERLDFDGIRDRFQMWVTANGTVKSWLSRRTLDAQAHRIDFHQEVPAGPAASLGGRWTVEAQGAAGSRLTLDHEFTVADDRPEDLSWVERATDTNSRAELARLKETAERWTSLDSLLLSFEESVRVKGPAELVYDFLCGIADWPGQVPHVSRADVAEDQPGVQVVRMETVSGPDQAQATEEVRICFPHALRIVHKQTRTPLLLEAHTGEWSVIPDETGVTAVARHNVLLREEAVEAVLGRGAGIQDARRHVRELLGGQSATVLSLAKRHAESTIRTL